MSVQSADRTEQVEVESPLSDAQIVRVEALLERYSEQPRLGPVDVDGVLGTTADQYAIAAGRPEQNASPRTVPWNNTGVPAGTHRIIAVTSDGRHSQVTATSAGTVTLDDAGLALQLLGDGGHVTFANPILGSRTTFTLEMWIKLWYPPVSGAPQPSHNLIYVESYVGGGTYNGAQRHFTFVSLNNGDIPDDLPGATVMVSWPNDGVGPYPYTDPVPEGQWMHLAYVRAGSTLRNYLPRVDGTSGRDRIDGISSICKRSRTIQLSQTLSGVTLTSFV